VDKLYMQVANSKLKFFPVKKIIILFLLFGFILDLTAQKQNKLDTLNIDQLNLYKYKAVKLRTTGMKLTLTGLGMWAGGWIITSKLGEAISPDLGFGLLENIDLLIVMAPAFIGTYVGIPLAIAGIPLFAIGGIKKCKAEIAIQKLNIGPDNSMALGLGITIRF